MDKKYRVTILLEKYQDRNNNEIIMEHNVSFDDFKTSNRMFVGLVGHFSNLKKEMEEYAQQKEKQQDLFKSSKPKK